MSHTFKVMSMYYFEKIAITILLTLSDKEFLLKNPIRLDKSNQVTTLSSFGPNFDIRLLVNADLSKDGTEANIFDISTGRAKHEKSAIELYTNNIGQPAFTLKIHNKLETEIIEHQGIEVNKPYYIVIKQRDGNLKLFINGVEINSLSFDFSEFKHVKVLIPHPWSHPSDGIVSSFNLRLGSKSGMENYA